VSGLSPLVDTLLATRLAQRVDLVPLKSEVQIAGPEAVAQVEEVNNDIRLPSRAAVEQQIGVGLLKSDQRGHGGMAGQTEQAVTLSPAARAVSAILESQSGGAARVIGSEPLLALSQPPPSPAEIAATLARTVSQSGLFYESHLAQFAAGARSLDELAREPQARLEGNLKAAPVAPGLPNLLDALDPDSAQLAQSRDVAQAHRNAYASMQSAEAPALAAKNHDESMANTARASAPSLAGIHQDAVALVRQQLELLAQPAFRWRGEAWPAVPMDWEIQQDERQADTGDESAPRSWNTRLALTLPTLRDIEVRISLVGNALQVRLAASESATREQVNKARAELPARLSALGLELTSLQIGSLAAAFTAHSTPKADDGA